MKKSRATSEAAQQGLSFFPHRTSARSPGLALSRSVSLYQFTTYSFLSSLSFLSLAPVLGVIDPRNRRRSCRTRTTVATLVFTASVGVRATTYTRHEIRSCTLQPNSLAATRAVPPYPAPISMRVHLSGAGPSPLGKHRERSSCVFRELALVILGMPSSSASSPWSLVYRPKWMCSSPHT